MKLIKVKVTFNEKVLGSQSNNKEIHADYIASKSPDKKSKEEEIAAVGIEAYEEKTMTVFPRMEDGTPMFWDYQIRGFFKDSCSALQRCKGEEISKESCKLKKNKKVIDGCIFVEPRQIPIHIPEGGEIELLQRPLRGQTAQGERIALATSETVPAGSWAEFTIRCLSDAHEKVVLEWLEYGRFKGMGQWRNAGFGRFSYDAEVLCGTETA